MEVVVKGGTEWHALGSRPIQDTPCTACGHGNAHGLGLVGDEPCREWMMEASTERIIYYLCSCPEWRSPPTRFYERLCWCGARGCERWLNGERACSAEHALSRQVKR